MAAFPPIPASRLLVIADTHLGLLEGKRIFRLKNNIQSDFTSLSTFLRWVKGLQTEPYNLPLGNGRVAQIEPPDEIILLGDFLELWDATDIAVEFASREIWQILREIPSRKIYPVGNHDYEVGGLAGKFKPFPIGEDELNIFADHYPPTAQTEGELPAVTLGSQSYLFVHGHQFDTTFRRIRAWALMSYLRDGAEAFRLYSWILIALTLLWIPYAFLSRDWYPIFLLLALGAFPKLLISIARPVYNKYLRTRYNWKKAVKGFDAWWKQFSKDKKPPKEPLFIVYGHTHLAGIHRKGSETLINVPAWVWDTDPKREPVLRDTALYIDSEGYKFIGWDWQRKTPFYVPDRILELREDGKGITTVDHDDLEKIGWPPKLLDKWRESL
jgi:UDP-2,3-diacylglucosamine pyrophosphatase LpxH